MKKKNPLRFQTPYLRSVQYDSKENLNFCMKVRGGKVGANMRDVHHQIYGTCNKEQLVLHVLEKYICNILKEPQKCRIIGFERISDQCNLIVDLKNQKCRL